MCAEMVWVGGGGKNLAYTYFINYAHGTKKIKKMKPPLFCIILIVTKSTYLQVQLLLQCG